ncbi:TetR/AcrR family transcriptional regulator [Brevibacillus borstelensis]|uniref:TetR/AcrR family transcriptional regulator n=1 Tax=Brevibacillus borstelensis TaxID=45462 RepID=UPI0030BAB5AA
MRSSKRVHILEAATRVILSEGAAQLTLDAVAKEAQVSKGGLLYHFSTKEALIEAIVIYAKEQIEKQFQAIYDEDDDPRGRWTRTYLKLTCDDRTNNNELYSALFSGVLENRELLRPLEECFLQLYAKTENDQIDPVLANIVCLVADGLWYNDMFQFNPVNDEMKAKIIDRLIRLTKGESE